MINLSKFVIYVILHHLDHRSICNLKLACIRFNELIREIHSYGGIPEFRWGKNTISMMDDPYYYKHYASLPIVRLTGDFVSWNGWHKLYKIPTWKIDIANVKLELLGKGNIGAVKYVCSRYVVFEKSSNEMAQRALDNHRSKNYIFSIYKKIGLNYLAAIIIEKLNVSACPKAHLLELYMQTGVKYTKNIAISIKKGLDNVSHNLKNQDIVQIVKLVKHYTLLTRANWFGTYSGTAADILISEDYLIDVALVPYYKHKGKLHDILKNYEKCKDLVDPLIIYMVKKEKMEDLKKLGSLGYPVRKSILQYGSDQLVKQLKPYRRKDWLYASINQNINYATRGYIIKKNMFEIEESTF
jgi:hypothetical protein